MTYMYYVSGFDVKPTLLTRPLGEFGAGSENGESGDVVVQECIGQTEASTGRRVKRRLGRAGTMQKTSSSNGRIYQ